MLVAVLVTITFFLGRNPVKTIDESDALATCSDAFAANIRSRMNGDDVIITVGGGSTEEFGYTFYVSDNMHLMVEGEFLRSLLLCSVQRYPDGTVLIMKGDNSISLAVGSDKATVNKKTEVELGDAVYVDEAEDKLMVPIDKIAEYLSYEVDYYVDQKWVDLARLPDETPLPEKYDMRDYGRVSPVRDQGRYGTCWAFASLGALETTLLPMEEDIFSVDHMSMCNSYALDVNSGGEHTMSIAYLAAWQGPVLEKDDPYGDGMSDPNLTAEKHLEEALIINGREDETIKSAISGMARSRHRFIRRWNMWTVIPCIIRVSMRRIIMMVMRRRTMMSLSLAGMIISRRRISRSSRRVTVPLSARIAGARNSAMMDILCILL